MRISLIGYMGSGKSTIGKELGFKLNIPFYDLDHLIEIHEKTSISNIFKHKGEKYFRKLEYLVLKNLLFSRQNFILALGGGTPMISNVMEMINSTSDSFYLSMTPLQLMQRLNKERYHRPIITDLFGKQLLNFITKHLLDRIPFYQLAKYKILIDNNHSKEIICEQIILKMNN